MTLDPQMPAVNLRAIFAVKVAVLLVIFVSFWTVELFVAHFEHRDGITIAGLVALIPSIAILASVQRVPAWLIRLSLVVDIFALTTAIHYGGGVDTVSMPLLYPAVISLSGILLTRAETFAIAVLAVVCYDVVAYSEYAGLLPHVVPYGRPPDRQLGTVLPVNAILLLYAWFVSYAMDTVRRLHRSAEEARREAMQTLSHDLKNPLSAIHGYARLLHDASPEERESFAHGIERSAQEAIDLVSNVLDAAAFDGQPIVARTYPVRLSDLVSEVANNYRYAAEAAEVELTTQTPGTLPPAEIDGQLVRRALSNLISNAIKYTAPNGKVCVFTSANDGYVRVQVQDTGRGIADNERPLLFRRYRRTSSARGVEGSGLGLYIVRRIAEAHRGSITCESTEGTGSVFTLSLPVAATHGPSRLKRSLADDD